MSETIFDRLREDHDRHRRLLDILSKTEGASDGREELFGKLKEDLINHAKAEERCFYAELLGVRESQNLSSHSIKEHEELEALVNELDELDFSSPQWLVKLKQLKHDVEHHEKEEEVEVFPVAGRVLTDEQKSRMVQTFNEMKKEEEARG